MRNLIFGGIGVLWGGAIVLYALFGGGPRAEGAYGAGQAGGAVFGFVMFAAGLFYLINGIRGMTPDEPRRKPRKRKRKTGGASRE
ncbi:MAG TPA: hypothetical protein VH092_19160 [Urbifossiella sp.]|jgi:hypothetical protein|nr:hypothetical protein [Urbifossiella sp.]